MRPAVTQRRSICSRRVMAVLLAEADERHRGGVVGLCGDSAWYLWGASSNEERNRMPNHALQWAGIRWAGAARRYDFWGIPDDVGKIAAGMASGDEASAPVKRLPINLDLLPQHGLWGVYRFKQGFGGKALRYVGAWDKRCSRWVTGCNTLGPAESARSAGRVACQAWPLMAGYAYVRRTVRPMCSRYMTRLVRGGAGRTAGTACVAELGMGRGESRDRLACRAADRCRRGRAYACRLPISVAAVEPLSARARGLCA